MKSELFCTSYSFLALLSAGSARQMYKQHNSLTREMNNNFMETYCYALGENDENYFCIEKKWQVKFFFLTNIFSVFFVITNVDCTFFLEPRLLKCLAQTKLLMYQRTIHVWILDDYERKNNFQMYDIVF